MDAWMGWIGDKAAVGDRIPSADASSNLARSTEVIQMSNEIKIGDTVDCSGCEYHLPAACVAGKVTYGPDRDGHYTVDGSWTDGQPWHYVRPDQITRHVPASPVVERSKSCGDKLASEMTVRTALAKDLVVCMLNNGFGIDNVAVLGVELADALIDALDKERT